MTGAITKGLEKAHFNVIEESLSVNAIQKYKDECALILFYTDGYETLEYISSVLVYLKDLIVTPKVHGQADVLPLSGQMIQYRPAVHIGMVVVKAGSVRDNIKNAVLDLITVAVEVRPLIPLIIQFYFTDQFLRFHQGAFPRILSSSVQ